MNIEYSNPEYLWLLASIPIMVLSHFALLRYNQFKALKFANFRALKRVTGSKLITKNYPALFLRVLTVLFLVFSLAQPVIWYEGDASNSDYVIAIDASASMSAQDFPPSRLDTAKNSAMAFADNLGPYSKIGVIRFAGATFVELPLDRNKDKAKSVIEDLDILRAGGTDIPGAIIAGTNLLTNSDEGKSIILLTDGSNTVGTFLTDSIVKATTYANEQHVRVYAVGIGSDSGPIGYLPEYYNISATYNEENLETIANRTNGLYFNALSYQDITEAYDQIIENDKTGMVSYETSFGLASLALLFIFVEWGLLNTRFRRFP